MRKRPKTRLDTAIVNVWQREVGELSTRNFAHRFAASEDLVLRLDLFRKLEKHRGCVNTVCFNADGDILVSGSDDRRVIFWEWETGRVKLSYHSGHYDNVFQAKIMPYTEDRTVVTCAADGQVTCFLDLVVADIMTGSSLNSWIVPGNRIYMEVQFSMVRHTQILERGEVETKLLGKHEGRAHKLAIEPGSPHIFYTCGEDGLVQHFDLRTGAATQLFTCQSLIDSSLSVDLNAIAIDPRNPNLVAIAGLDEYTRLYDIRKYNWDGSTDFGQPTDYFCPPHLIGHEQAAITGLAFSDLSELLVSYSDEFIYLFTRKMGLGPHPPPASPLSVGSDAGEMGPEQKSASPPSDVDVEVGPQVYKGHKNCETVKGVNFFGPKCEYVVSGSDCGRIFIWKKKGGELIRVMEADEHVVNCIESHPHSTVLVSSGIEDNIKVWTPKALDGASLPTNIEKVLKPNRLRFFPIADIEDDDDDDDDYEYEYDYDDEDSDGAGDGNGVSDGDNDEDDDDEDDDDDEEDDDDDGDDDDDSNAGDGFGDHSDGFSCDGNDDCKNG